MYDMHNDLLTILYYAYKHSNSVDYVSNLQIELAKLHSYSIKGGIINLSFMSEEEMFKKYDITKEELDDIYTMFKESIEYLIKQINCGAIGKDVEYIYGIEGCDYIKDLSTLENLYYLGLRSIIPVWNNENRYGSGIRTDNGLTDEGTKLIEKAMQLNMIIDLSHANQSTYFDIINTINNSKDFNPVIIASHSNVQELCNKKRNLSNQQLKALKDINGYIGLFTNELFLADNKQNLSNEEIMLYFMKHLKYLIEEIGFNTNKILVATDDINFKSGADRNNPVVNDAKYLYASIFNEIKKRYGTDIASDILTNNAQKLIAKVKKL